MLKLRYQTSYKPVYYYLKKKNNKIFLKNFLYFFLLLNFLSDKFKNFSYSFFFFKKKKNFKNLLKAPNRYKKAQKKLYFTFFLGILQIKYNILYLNHKEFNILNIKNFFFFYYYVIFYFKNFFKFFESTLLSLQKYQIFFFMNFKFY